VSDDRLTLGRAAEESAAAFLERSGLRVVARNVRSRLGEIDLVCRERDVWVFVEARWGDAPSAAVSIEKQRRLARLAALYLKSQGLRDVRCRFDVVAVTIDADGTSQVRHLPAAFDAPAD